MRTDNSRVKNSIISIYFILVVLMFALTFFPNTLKFLSNNIPFSYILSGFVLIFFAVHFISRYFEYDSDGVKVVVINKGLLLSDHFNYREKLLEFEKEKLISYTFKNYFIYKSLTFYLRESRGHKTRETFNVTLVSPRKRKYIRQSLNKIIKANRKAT